MGVSVDFVMKAMIEWMWKLTDVLDYCCYSSFYYGITFILKDQNRLVRLLIFATIFIINLLYVNVQTIMGECNYNYSCTYICINNICIFVTLIFSEYILQKIIAIAIDSMYYNINKSDKYKSISIITHLLIYAHKFFYLFFCIIFSTLSENDYCLLNIDGQASTHHNPNAMICTKIRT